MERRSVVEPKNPAYGVNIVHLFFYVVHSMFCDVLIPYLRNLTVYVDKELGNLCRRGLVS